MIEDEPPDPLVQPGPVGGGDQNQENPPEAQQRSPDSLPDFEDHEPQAKPDALGDPMDGVLPGEMDIPDEEIPASPIMPEAQVENIEADNALAAQLQADEQIAADNAYARQLQGNHSIPARRQWPTN